MIKEGRKMVWIDSADTELIKIDYRLRIINQPN
jgi:hypothetical protein